MTHTADDDDKIAHGNGAHTMRHANHQDEAVTNNHGASNHNRALINYIALVDSLMVKSFGVTYKQTVSMAPSLDYYGALVNLALENKLDPNDFARYFGRKAHFAIINDNHHDMPSDMVARYNLNNAALFEIAHQPDCEWAITQTGSIVRRGHDGSHAMIVSSPGPVRGIQQEPCLDIWRGSQSKSDFGIRIGTSGVREVVIPHDVVFTKQNSQADVNDAIAVANAYIDTNPSESNVADIEDMGMSM